MQSRRDFLKSAGVLVVSFSASSLVPELMGAQGPFATHPSHVDPTRLDSWIAVAADGTVTACTGKCDLGQGIFTAQAQLVAEELCVPFRLGSSSSSATRTLRLTRERPLEASQHQRTSMMKTWVSQPRQREKHC